MTGSMQIFQAVWFPLYTGLFIHLEIFGMHGETRILKNPTFLLWRFSHIFQNRENMMMNSYVPII